jgi:colanic acid/amylovoran biosynthesis protein
MPKCGLQELIELQVRKMMKIAITNAYSSRNQGDAAIVVTTLQLLRQELPDARFTIFSLHPDQDEKFYRSRDADVEPNPIMPRSKAFVLAQFMMWILIASLGVRVRKATDHWIPFSIYRKLRESDVHISCGGAYLNDSWGFSYMVHLLTIIVSRLLRKPIILYPQTIGPFRKRLGRLIVRFVLNRVDAIFVRDIYSEQYLSNALRITRTPIYRGADAAFLLQPASPRRTREMLEEEGLGKDKPLVGMTVRRWVFPFAKNAPEEYHHFKSMMARIADHVIESKGAVPVFVPMVSIPGKPLEQDDEASRDVIRAMKHGNVAKLVKPSHYTPEEIKSLIGEMALQVGTRMHSVIFASSMNVPVVAVAYEPKTFSLMEALGLNRFVFGIEALDFEEMVRGVDVLWKDREEWTRVVAPRVESMRQDATRAASIVAVLCKSLVASMDQDGSRRMVTR